MYSRFMKAGASRLSWPLGARLLGTTVVLACDSGDARRASAVASWDSAGVEIVRSTPHWDRGFAWSIGPEPDLQIGSVDGAPESLFQAIRATVTLPDGRIAVVDARSYEIRLFGPDGRFIRAFGRQGQGPGEFADDPFIAVLPPDTIVAWDQVQLRLTWFHTEAGRIRDASLATALQHLGIPRVPGATVTWRLRADGTLLSPTGPLRFPSGPGPHVTTHTPILVRQTTTDPELVSLGEFAVGRHIVMEAADRHVTVAAPWWPRGPLAFGDDPYPLAHAPDFHWEIRLYGRSGELSRIIRADIARAPLTTTIIERERETIAGRLRLSPGDVERAFRQLGVPDSLPAIADLRWSASGDLWARRWTAESADTAWFDVIAADGRWLGSVHAPPDIGRILEVGRTHVLTAWTSDMGVPFLRRHPIRRSER